MLVQYNYTWYHNINVCAVVLRLHQQPMSKISFKMRQFYNSFHHHKSGPEVRGRIFCFQLQLSTSQGFPGVLTARPVAGHERPPVIDGTSNVHWMEDHGRFYFNWLCLQQRKSGLLHCYHNV